jgi:hypothetical protein
MMRLGLKVPHREAGRSKLPASRVIWVLLLLAALIGLGAVLKGRRSPTPRRDDAVIDVTDAPVVPAQASAGTPDSGLPVAGTASSDGGIGAASTQA